MLRISKSLYKNSNPQQDGVDEKIDYLDTWRGFEAVLEQGLVKSIGVSNFNVNQLSRLLANCKVVPAVNQVEVSEKFFFYSRVNLYPFYVIYTFVIDTYY